VVHDRPIDDIPPRTLYELLQLRSQVFVVEQACLFLDPDGKDLDDGCRHLWIEDAGGHVVAAARVLDQGDARRIGRIVTDPAARGRGLAGELVRHFLDAYDGPWVLDGQAHLAGWYETFGFEISGAEYLDDGIPHVPMTRADPRTGGGSSFRRQ
jgi:ElaA protein